MTIWQNKMLYNTGMEELPPMEILIRRIEAGEDRDKLVAEVGEWMVTEAESFLV